MGRSKTDHRLTISIAAMGTVVVWAYGALALVQIFVLNPLAAVPGQSLEQIQQEMAAAGESMTAPLVIGSMAAGPVAAACVLAATVIRPGAGAQTMLILYLTLLTFGPMAYFWASFGPAMSLADTYFISGGDHSLWATPLLSAVSPAAFLGLVLVVVTASVRTSRTGATHDNAATTPSATR